MTPVPFIRINTRHKKLVDLNDVKPEDLCLDDIAWSLAGINRWCAHGSVPYFVTDHLEAVYRAIRSDAAEGKNTATPIEEVHALLHDAHEAYTNDLSAPLKRYIAQFTEALSLLEQRIDQAIAQHFGIADIPYNESLIHEYDMLAREQEHAFLFEGKSNDLLNNTINRSTQEVRARRFKSIVEDALARLRMSQAKKAPEQLTPASNPAMASSVTLTLTEDQLAELREALRHRADFKITLHPMIHS